MAQYNLSPLFQILNPGCIGPIYNSVCTRRHTHINSSASVSLNATKIAVMKVSHLGGGGGDRGWARIIIFLIYVVFGVVLHEVAP